MAVAATLLSPSRRQRLLRREVNERIYELNASFGTTNGDSICECAREECAQRIEVHASVVVERQGNSLLVDNRGQVGFLQSRATRPDDQPDANAEGVMANVMTAADGEKRESEDPDAEDPPSPATSDADGAKDKEREMEESGEELPG
jgi:hypothetical protein